MTKVEYKSRGEMSSGTEHVELKHCDEHMCEHFKTRDSVFLVLFDSILGNSNETMKQCQVNKIVHSATVPGVEVEGTGPL